MRAFLNFVRQERFVSLKFFTGCSTGALLCLGALLCRVNVSLHDKLHGFLSYKVLERTLKIPTVLEGQDKIVSWCPIIGALHLLIAILVKLFQFITLIPHHILYSCSLIQHDI